MQGAPRNVPDVLERPRSSAATDRGAGLGRAVVVVGVLRDGLVSVDPGLGRPWSVPGKLDVVRAGEFDLRAIAAGLAPDVCLVHQVGPALSVGSTHPMPPVTGADSDADPGLLETPGAVPYAPAVCLRRSQDRRHRGESMLPEQ